MKYTRFSINICTEDKYGATSQEFEVCRKCRDALLNDDDYKWIEIQPLPDNTPCTGGFNGCEDMGSNNLVDLSVEVSLES